MNYFSEIIGTGSHFPATVMTNKDFETFIDTNDEWIQTRTGIKQRRIIDHKLGESTMSLALEAARKAIALAQISPEDIELIIVGTVTPDHIMPCTANMLQKELGAKKAFGFDLQAACSGFLYGMSIADHFIRLGSVKHALVIGAESLSTLINWKDRGTCVLFGDGAGAVIMRQTQDQNHSILGTHLYADGVHCNLLSIPHGYAKMPTYRAEYRHDKHTIHMEGKEIFKLAVRAMVDSSIELLNEHHIAAEQVDFFILHQANSRIIEMCMKALNIPPEKTWLNVDKYGNTSAATLPVCLDEAYRSGAIKKGNLVLMATFGGGVTWASALFRL